MTHSGKTYIRHRDDTWDMYTTPCGKMFDGKSVLVDMKKRLHFKSCKDPECRRKVELKEKEQQTSEVITRRDK